MSINHKREKPQLQTWQHKWGGETKKKLIQNTQQMNQKNQFTLQFRLQDSKWTHRCDVDITDVSRDHFWAIQNSESEVENVNKPENSPKNAVFRHSGKKWALLKKFPARKYFSCTPVPEIPNVPGKRKLQIKYFSLQRVFNHYHGHSIEG